MKIEQRKILYSDDRVLPSHPTATAVLIHTVYGTVFVISGETRSLFEMSLAGKFYRRTSRPMVLKSLKRAASNFARQCARLAKEQQ